jgi:hypothetical protein
MFISEDSLIASIVILWMLFLVIILLMRRNIPKRKNAVGSLIDSAALLLGLFGCDLAYHSTDVTVTMRAYALVGGLLAFIWALYDFKDRAGEQEQSYTAII